MNVLKSREKPASEMFMDLIASEMHSHLPPHDSIKGKQLSQVFMNDLLDLPGPRSLEPVTAADSKFAAVLANGYFEIQTTYFTVANVPEYFRRSPQRLPNARADYLAFVVHAYLNEVYVLEERMCAFLKALPRAASKNSEMRKQLEAIEPCLLKLVRESFKNIRSSRATHVHQQRFVDDGIHRLSTLEMLSPHFPPLEGFYLSELRRVRKTWGERFAANDIAIKDCLDHYYAEILTIVSTKDGGLRSPT
jgi:hypothetical protein